MGNANYDATSFQQTYKHNVAQHGNAFSHNTNVATGIASGIHPLLDPKRKNKLGQFIRESRDSPAHPASKGVWINFDATGSMVRLPHQFVIQLPRVMELLVKDGWLQNPHVLFSVNCDHADPYPFQLGQFEGGNEITDVLTNVLLPGGGTGSAYGHEAYNLALYMAGFHTQLDCVEKRGEKGYMFFIGDERPNDHLTATQINAVFDCGEERDFTFEELLAAATKNFHIHWIMPQGASHYQNGAPAPTGFIDAFLKQHFGENYHCQPSDSTGVFPDVAELIVGLIAMHEGVDFATVKSATASASASSVLTTFNASRSITAKTGGSSTALVDAATPATRL